jgi:hypothetical protein
MEQTRMQRVVDGLFAQLYGQPLGEWIADQREAGASWRLIEKELYVKTDGVVDVSHPTLIAWYGDRDEDRAGAA